MSDDSKSTQFALLKLKMKTLIRCPWCEGFDLYRQYHDTEWGVPLRDSQKLFELLILEGAQAGLSWSTVLKKRESYREAFDGFDPKKIAKYGERKVAELMANSGIVRNRLKISATIGNAKAYLALEKKGVRVYHIFIKKDNLYYGNKIFNKTEYDFNLPNELNFKPNYYQWLINKQWKNEEDIHYTNNIQKELAEEYIKIINSK
jgi:3-methyladenine DNA glycosylase Tag